MRIFTSGVDYLYSLSDQMCPSEDKEVSDEISLARKLDAKGFRLLINEDVPNSVVMPDRRIFSYRTLLRFHKKNMPPRFGDDNFLLMDEALQYLILARQFTHS